MKLWYQIYKFNNLWMSKEKYGYVHLVMNYVNTTCKIYRISCEIDVFESVYKVDKESTYIFPFSF